MADDEDKLVTKPFKFVTGDLSFSLKDDITEKANAEGSWYVTDVTRHL